MYRYYLKYFIGFFVVVGLIIILIILLFGGGKTNPIDQGTQSQSTQKLPTKLSDLADTDDQVRLIIAGNVVANQNYYEVQITSDRNQNQFNIIQGYEGQVISSKTYNNNQSAYTTFLKALQHAGYMLGDKNSIYADDRGYCPLGLRYIYQIIENGKTVQQYWASSCAGSAPQTYKGSALLTNKLFQLQIPDYESLTATSNIDSAGF